jgi:hypothetical protein
MADLRCAVSFKSPLARTVSGEIIPIRGDSSRKISGDLELFLPLRDSAKKFLTNVFLAAESFAG